MNRLSSSLNDAAPQPPNSTTERSQLIDNANNDAGNVRRQGQKATCWQKKGCTTTWIIILSIIIIVLAIVAGVLIAQRNTDIHELKDQLSASQSNENSIQAQNDELAATGSDQATKITKLDSVNKYYETFYESKLDIIAFVYSDDLILTFDINLSS